MKLPMLWPSRNFGIPELLVENSAHSVEILHHIHVAARLAEIAQHVAVADGIPMADVVVSDKRYAVPAEELREPAVALKVLAHAVGEHYRRPGIFRNIHVISTPAKPGRTRECSCYPGYLHIDLRSLRDYRFQAVYRLTQLREALLVFGHNVPLKAAVMQVQGYIFHREAVL